MLCFCGAVRECEGEKELNAEIGGVSVCVCVCVCCKRERGRERERLIFL